MSDVLLVVGLVLAVEGAFYGLMPGAMRDMARRVQDTPVDTLRIAGVVALALGVGIVWLVRAA